MDETKPETGAATEPNAAPKPRNQAAKPNAAPKGPAASPAAPVASSLKPIIRDRHDVAFRHDVYRSDNKNCLRNLSYKHREPDIQKILHAHVFHSHSNQGKKLSRTGSACGHWHEITETVDPVTMLPKAICGPAMHEVTTMTSSGRTVTKNMPVTFEQEVKSGENDGELILIADDHIHEMNYLGSENLSPSQIQNSLKAQQAEAAAMGVMVGGVKDNTPAPMTAADGANIS